MPLPDPTDPVVEADPVGSGRDPVTDAFVAGTDDALRLAYEAHGQLVYTFCRRALGTERAADATQEVFTQLWRTRERFDPDQGSLRGWVMGIARFKVLGVLRRDGARPVVAVDPVDESAASASTAGAPDTDIEGLADRLTLAQALGTLPDRTRKAIHLSYVDGLSHREISAQLGLPLGSVKSDIRRGLERLRLDLGRRS